MDEQKKAAEAAAPQEPTEPETEGAEELEDETDLGSEPEEGGDEKPETPEEPEAGDFDEAKYRKLIAEGKGENALGELKRLAAQAAKVKTEPVQDKKLPPGQEPEYLKDFKKALRDEGFEGLSDKMIKTMANIAADIAETKVSGMRGDYAERQLDKTISKLGERKEYKAAISQYGKDLEKAIRTYPNKYWDDEELLEAELGKLVLRGMGKTAKPAAPKPVIKISEGSGAARGVTSISGGIRTAAIESYADQNGWNSKDPETRNKIIRILKLKKSTEDRTNVKT